MSRYFAMPKADRPRADHGGDNPLLPSITVDDNVPVYTGLVDQRGYPIMRAPNPMGFGADL